MHVNSMSTELPILYFKGSQVEFFHLCHEDLFLSLQTVQNLMKCHLYNTITLLSVN